MTSHLETLDLNMKKYTASMQQMAELQMQREQAIREDKEAYRIKKQTFDLLPNADENIAKLQVKGGEERKGRGEERKWERRREAYERGCIITGLTMECLYTSCVSGRGQGDNEAWMSRKPVILRKSSIPSVSGTDPIEC